MIYQRQTIPPGAELCSFEGVLPDLCRRARVRHLQGQAKFPFPKRRNRSSLVAEKAYRPGLPNLFSGSLKEWPVRRRRCLKMLIDLVFMYF